jgi:DNA-binding response OmpR family regulator
MARRYLTRAGATVAITTGAAETTAALIARTADVAILDLTMPGLDARRLRRLIIDQRRPQQAQKTLQPLEPLQSQKTQKMPQSQSNRPPQKTPPSRLPTLFLLSPSMRPRDLRIAAESCLYRPFSPRLLVSRVLAVAPRPAASHPAAPRSVTPSPAAHSTPGQPTPTSPIFTSSPTSPTHTTSPTTSPTRIPVPTSPLTPAESALLSALADHPGHVLSRGRLQAIVGRSTPGHPASGRAIDVHVSSLRAKLPDPSLVRTVRGVGYILDEPSQILDEPGQTGSDAPGGQGG